MNACVGCDAGFLQSAAGAVGMSDVGYATRDRQWCFQQTVAVAGAKNDTVYASCDRQWCWLHV